MSIEKYHERGHYILFNPHSKLYYAGRSGDGLVSISQNLFKAKAFQQMDDTLTQYQELEGFQWRAVHVAYTQTLI